jgi:hypothetical protein
MHWEIWKVTRAATKTDGYQSRRDDAFRGTEHEAQSEIERRAEHTGLKCFALRMDSRRGREHLRVPSMMYLASKKGAI